MNELLTCVSNLFNKYGIKSITMDDIYRELGISKKTLYKHFKNKNDIINKIAQFDIKNELDELQILYTENKHPIDQLLVISRYLSTKSCKANLSILLYSMNKYYPKVLEKILNERKSKIIDLISSNFYTGINEGLYRDDIDIETIPFFYSFLLDIKSVEIYSDWLNKNFENRFNSFFIYHLRAIATIDGIEYFEKNKFKY